MGNDEVILGESIIKPKQPAGEGWTQGRKPPAWVTQGYAGDIWFHENGITVISAVEVASDPGRPSLGPEYHLSISKNGGICKHVDAIWVLDKFGLDDAKEDNHVPDGFVRNFWRPVADNLSGYECPCKDEEPAIKKNKGDYVWRGITK